MMDDKVLSLDSAAKRIGKTVRTLWRWQSLGVLRILPGGFVVEEELLRAEAKIRQRRAMLRYVQEAKREGDERRQLQQEAWDRGWRDCARWWMGHGMAAPPKNPYDAP